MNKRVALPTLLLTLAVAVPASPETYLTAFAGAAFAGNTDDSKLTFGGDLAFAGRGPFGLSVDFGYTKHFFGNTPPVGDNNVTTLMGNLMLISPPGHPRIYASGGLGLLKTRVKDVDGFFDVDSTDFGLDVGGGIYVGDGPLGFRADIRYFRTFTDPEPDGEFDVDLGNLDYWRATAGVMLRF